MTRLIRVVPAILTDDPVALQTMVKQAESFTDYVQFDIMDGQFVPSRSITSKHLAALTMKLGWEAHLMIKSPENFLAGFRKAGAQKVVFHYEAAASPEKVISKARDLGLKVGIALNPETSLEALESLRDKIDSVLFLTVNPGFYGSPFIPSVMDKVAAFRPLRPAMEIGVDGGIKESNISAIARSGVDVVYVGSAIFRQPDPAASYHKLQKLVSSGK